MKKVLFAGDYYNHLNEEFEDVMFLKSINKVVNEKGIYLALTFSDKEGMTAGKVWSDYYNESMLSLEEKLVVASGKVGLYDGKITLAITSLREISKNEVDLSDFVVVNPHIDDMLIALSSLAERVVDPFLRRVLEVFFGDARIMKSFARCQGGSAIHHTHIGGLLNHTLMVTNSAIEYVQNFTKYSPHKYPIDLDLVIAGALLHDIGKLKEYSYFPINKRTVIGKLMGHISIGLDMVSEAIAIAKNGFDGDVDEEKILILKHIILSSHGDKGSVPPETLEAVIISKMDDLDADMSGVEVTYAGEEHLQRDDDFTYSNRWMNNTQFLKTRGGEYIGSKRAAQM